MLDLRCRTFSMLCTLILLMVLDCSCKAQPLKLAENGHSTYAIVIRNAAGEDELRASAILRTYIKKVTGVELAIKKEQEKITGPALFIAPAAYAQSQFTKKGISVPARSTEFVLITNLGSNIYLIGNGARGCTYAAYSFIEKYLGCRKLTPQNTYVPQKKTVQLDNKLYLFEAASLSLRIHNFYFYDQEYMDWHKLNSVDGPTSQWGEWVISFNQIVPPEQYFAAHPEYYALRNGKRTPTQLCLTNPALPGIAIEYLKKEMAKKKNALYWTICQNDNWDYCQCDNCNRVNKKEDSQQGTILTFINNVAAKFPDKFIATHAFLYSMNPPKSIRPAKNVYIIVSAIGVPRNRPIATGNTPDFNAFRDNFEKWQKITTNVLVWDYVVRFTDYLSAFPNIYTWQENLKYFIRHGAKGVFEQAAGGAHTDMRELKSYLLAKLLWNTDTDVKACIKDFTDHYYEAGASAVYNYVDAINSQAMKDPQMLMIYGSPKELSDMTLSPQNIGRYLDYLTQGKNAAKNNSPVYNRIDLLELGVDCAKFAIGKGKENATINAKTTITGTSASVLTRRIQDICIKNNINLVSEQGSTIQNFLTQP